MAICMKLVNPNVLSSLCFNWKVNCLHTCSIMHLLHIALRQLLDISHPCVFPIFFFNSPFRHEGRLVRSYHSSPKIGCQNLMWLNLTNVIKLCGTETIFHSWRKFLQTAGQPVTQLSHFYFPSSKSSCQKAVCIMGRKPHKGYLTCPQTATWRVSQKNTWTTSSVGRV